MKMDAMKSKTKTPTGRHKPHTIQIINNPIKQFEKGLMTQKSNKTPENCDEDLAEEKPISNIEHINKVSISNIHHNNLSELNTKRNFIPRMNLGYNPYHQPIDHSYINREEMVYGVPRTLEYEE